MKYKKSELEKLKIKYLLLALSMEKSQKDSIMLIVKHANW